MSNAQAGPSKSKTKHDPPEVIDLTLDDDEEDVIPVPSIIKMQYPATSKQNFTSPVTLDSSVMELHSGRHERPNPAKRKQDEKRDEVRKAEKGKQMDRGRESLGGMERGDWIRKPNGAGTIHQQTQRNTIPADGSNMPKRNHMTAHSSNNTVEHRQNRLDTIPPASSNMPKRTHTTAHPSHGLPSAHERLMARQHTAASTTQPTFSKKRERPKDSQRSTSPQKQPRPIASSSGASQTNGPRAATSNIASFLAKAPVASYPATGPGRPRPSAEPQEPTTSVPTSYPLAKTISSNSSNGFEIHPKHSDSQRRGSTFLDHTSSGRSKSPTKANNVMSERGLVPGSRENGKQREVISEERGRPDRPISAEQRTKRDRSAAFGSTGKPDPKSGIKGRQRDLNSSAEARRILSPGLNTGTPVHRPHHLGRVLERSLSNGGATPTPSARPLPPVSGPNESGRNIRNGSPLKESVSSRNMALRQPIANETNNTDPPATLPRQTSPSKPSLPSTSATKAARLEVLSRNRWREKPSPNKNVPTHVIDEDTLMDPDYKTHRRSKVHQEEEEEEEECEEENPEPRPKRARPATGTYTVPSMDDPNWPTRNGSSGNEAGSKRRNRRKSRRVSNTQAEASESLAPVPKGNIDNSDAQTIISISSTHLSSPKKLDQPGSRSRPNHPINTSASASKVISPIAGPNKIEPTTPQSHKRLSTQSPRTLSKQSFNSSLSVLKTPSRRKARHATSAPKTPHDGPEEEEEPVENRPPTPAKASEPQEDDLLAMFAEYDFGPASPEQSLKNGTPKTPKADDGPTTPRSSTTKTHLTPGSRPILAETMDPNATPSAHRLDQIMKSPLHGLSPKRPRNISSRSLVDEILKNAEAAEKKKHLERVDREERRKRLEAIIEDGPHVELQDISAIDMEAPNDHDHDAAEEDAQEDSIASRRAKRVRMASLPNPKSKQSESAKSQLQPHLEKRAPTAADRFFRQQRNAAPGTRVGDTDLIMQVISRSTSPKKLSGLDLGGDHESEEESDIGLAKELRLDLLRDNEDISGLVDFAQEVEGSRRNSAPVECKVFWSKNSADLPKPSRIVSNSNGELGLRTNIPAALRSIVFPALQGPPDETLFVEALTEQNVEERSVLLASLTHAFSIAPLKLFGIVPGFFSSICSIWIALGARKQLLDTLPRETLFPKGVYLDREEASSLICELIRLKVAHERSSVVDVNRIRKCIPPLLLLAVDRETSPALRRTLDETLALIWSESAYIYEDIIRRESFYTDGAGVIALDLVHTTELLPMAIKLQVLLAIGHSTFESRTVSRWYAAGLLLPGCLKGFDQAIEQRTPSVDLIIEGAERIIPIMNSPQPEFDLIDQLVTCLYAVLSDIELLVTETPYNPTDSEENHPLMDLRALLVKIHHSLKAPGDDISKMQVSQTKARLSQLAIIVEMQFETAFRRMKKDKARMKLGKGLKEGKNGQAMLAFSRDVTMSTSASVERGV